MPIFGCPKRIRPFRWKWRTAPACPSPPSPARGALSTLAAAAGRDREGKGLCNGSPNCKFRSADDDGATAAAPVCVLRRALDAPLPRTCRVHGRTHPQRERVLFHRPSIRLSGGGESTTHDRFDWPPRGRRTGSGGADALPARGRWSPQSERRPPAALDHLSISTRRSAAVGAFTFCELPRIPGLWKCRASAPAPLLRWLAGAGGVVGPRNWHAWGASAAHHAAAAAPSWRIASSRR